MWYLKIENIAIIRRFREKNAAWANFHMANEGREREQKKQQQEWRP